jgi:glycosyltransferase involved in cell wall biosynthesis
MAPSLRECGGCALLEAMAMGKAIVAANWAGPSEFLSGGCALLVEPSSRKAFVDGLARAMLQLARSEELRHQLGHAAAERVRKHAFDWDTKVERLIAIFSETLQRSSPQPAPAASAERPSLTMAPAAEG